MTPNVLLIACPYCRAPVGGPCSVRVFGAPRPRGARRPHAARVKLALVLAAHADPALDAHFPKLGPCGLCGVPGLNQRHRVIDAIAGMLEAGEDPDETAREYGMSREAVDAVMTWSRRWPGAWL